MFAETFDTYEVLIKLKSLAKRPSIQDKAYN